MNDGAVTSGRGLKGKTRPRADIWPFPKGVPMLIAWSPGFSDHDVAAKTLQLMGKIAGELDESLIELQGQIPEAEWNSYRLGIGHILAEMLGEVLYHIGKRHPDLRPKSTASDRLRAGRFQIKPNTRSSQRMPESR